MNSDMKVFVVGPYDTQLLSMFASQDGYANVSNPEAADLICFQGGADVNPALYNEEAMSRTYFNKDRDQVDMNVWEKVSKTKPKVGICRGGQFLNVMSEGSMWQHVDKHGSAHTMTNLLELPGTVFGQGAEIEVTSDHHQMMRPNLHYAEVLGITNLATQFMSPSKEPDPEYDTEVCFYNHTQSLCFQPHPEYSYKIFTRTYFFKLLEFFFR